MPENKGFNIADFFGKCQLINGFFECLQLMNYYSAFQISFLPKPNLLCVIFMKSGFNFQR